MPLGKRIDQNQAEPNRTTTPAPQKAVDSNATVRDSSNDIAIPFDINTYACRISCPPNGWNDSILSGNAIFQKKLHLPYSTQKSQNIDSMI